jgi:hypothetical protein
MAAQLPAKSILKQQEPQSTLSDEQKAKAEQDRRNLGIALHHANRIQHRKDIDARIFANIETLLEFPSATPFSPPDASRFVSLIRAFQPSDYDNLVEERRIDGKCGYALCSNSPRSITMGASAAWKLKSKGAADYCSDNCVRKALYVKTQLSEVPAWERQPGQQPHIVLHMDDRRSDPTSLAIRTRVPQTSHDQLAAERGDATTSFRPGQVMTASVVENHNPAHTTSSAEHQPQSHTAIEGYEPASFGEEEVANPTSEENFVLDDDIAPISKSTDGVEEEESWRDLFDNIDQR